MTEFCRNIGPVYKEPGCVLSEVPTEGTHLPAQRRITVYQESLELELGFRDIPFSSKAELAVFYKGKRLTKTYIPDLNVFGALFVEPKAVRSLEAGHEQLPRHSRHSRMKWVRTLLNDMHLTQKAVGYLVNFGTPVSVQWRRFMLKENSPGGFN